MPQQLTKDKNGRWVLTGSDTQVEAQPYAHATPKPAAAKPQGKPPEKPWWHKVANEIAYIGKQVGKMNAGRVLISGSAGNPLMGGDPVYRNYNLPGTSPRAYESSLPSTRQFVAAASVGAADNAAKFGYSMYQRHIERKPKANPDAGPFGRGLNQVVDATYQLLGAKPPSQQDGFERGFDSFARSTGLNAAVGAVEAPVLAGAKALPVFKTLLANPTVHAATGFALNEALSTYLDDNRGGNFVDLINGLTGAKLPGGVDVGNADMVDAANQSVVPNAIAAAVPGAILGTAFWATKRFLKGSRTVEEISNSRGALENAGLTQTAEDDRVAFTPQAKQAPEPAAAAPAPRTPKEAEAGIQALIDAPSAPKAESAPAPSADTAEALPDPWAEQHDPSLPEADVVYHGLTQLDDTELQVAAQQSAPVVPTVDAVIAGRPTPDLHPNPEGLAWQDITAPTVSLAPESIADYGRLKQDDLEAMVAVNPNLQQRITEATGRDPGEYTRQDIVDALHGAAADGEAVIPRDFKQPTMRTDQINVDPQRFQYKQGVNAEGEQIGNSLSGVGAWNPSLENSIDVWQDPADGKYFVVNGHNRLAKAKALGVPTLKVNELMSPTAEAARVEGALSNMAQGSGTAFDAAKFFRDSPVPMDAALAAAGVPMKSGMAKQGLALSKLPDFAFQAAVDGELPIGKAVTLGESGLDEAGMTAAYRELKARPMGDAQFNEFLQITKSAGVVEGQVDLFGNADFVNTAAQKADLVASIKSLLASNKKLFGTVGRNAATLEGAGNTIDKAGAKAISGEAARALTIFDQVKYETGPVSDLLNEGAARIANGEKAAVVAKQIQNRIANAIKQSMGAEPTLPGDVVQPDLMNAAAAAPEATPAAAAAIDPALMDKAFAHLSPAQREALRAQVMQKAIANGEVRPPETPIPALPDGPAVSLKAAADDLLAGTVKPGSPAAQAIADEVRLRAEYAQQDADIRWQQEQALRDATNYEELPFDQKKALGMGDGFDKQGAIVPSDVINPEVLPPEKPPGIADRFKALIDEMKASDERMLRSVGAIVQGVRTGLNDLQAIDFQLPRDLSGSRTNWGGALLDFETDLDKTAYILAGDAKGASKRAAKFREAVLDAGINLEALVEHGKQLKKRIKDYAGTSQPSNASGVVSIPNQGFVDNGAPSPAIQQRAQARLEANTQAIDDIRRKAQQEGC